MAVLSEEFIALSPDEQRRRIKAAGGSDRSTLPTEVRRAMAAADEQIRRDWEGQLQEEQLVDQTTKKAG